MNSPAGSWSARIAAATAIAHQIAAKTLRDALFLSYFPVEKLPQVVVLSAGVSIAVVLVASRLLTRFGPARVVPWVFALDAAVFGAAWFTLPVLSHETAVAVYFAVSALGALLVSGFWSAFNESFDPHAAKVEVARVGASATLGGVSGGGLAERASAVVGPRGVLLVLVALALVGGFYVRRFTGRRRHAVQSPLLKTQAGAAVVIEKSNILRSPLLMRVGLLVALLAVASTLLDFVLKAEAQQKFPAEHDLVTFFAAFYTVVSIATFIVQTSLSSRMLQKAGLGSTLALLPLGIVTGAGLASVTLKVWSAALSKGIEAALTNSTHRSAYELLFTPLSKARKRRTKLIIDVLLQRLGDALGGLTVVGIGFVFVQPSRGLLWITFGIGVLLVWLVRSVNKAYVAELVGNLERNLLKVEEYRQLDATTRRVIETTVSLNRKGLLAEIERQRAQQSDAPPSADDPPSELCELLTLCTRRDPGLVDRLKKAQLDRRLAPCVVDLLSEPALEAAARDYLDRLGIHAVGALGDALLEHSASLSRQLILVELLAKTHCPAALAHLWAALDDGSPSLRLAVGATLVRWKQEVGLPFQPSSALVLSRVERDLERDDWLPDSLHPVLQRGPHPLLQEHRVRSPRLLQAFTLLALLYEPEPLSLALRGLDSGDPVLRGTAIEYLENTVPKRVKQRILDAL
ncbi:MAG: Npt1/Npt2 family nucleotide transporter [Polyangiaceae bacterium]